MKVNIKQRLPLSSLFLSLSPPFFFPEAKQTTTPLQITSHIMHLLFRPPCFRILKFSATGLRTQTSLSQSRGKEAQAVKDTHVLQRTDHGMSRTSHHISNSLQFFMCYYYYLNEFQNKRHPQTKNRGSVTLLHRRITQNIGQEQKQKSHWSKTSF